MRIFERVENVPSRCSLERVLNVIQEEAFTKVGEPQLVIPVRQVA